MARRSARGAAVLACLLGLGASVKAAPRYDLLLQGGHLIDPRNGVSAVRDLAIANGRVAAVAERGAVSFELFLGGGPDAVVTRERKIQNALFAAVAAAMVPN